MSLRKIAADVFANRLGQLAITVGVFGGVGLGVNEVLDNELNSEQTEASAVKTASYSSRIQTLSEQNEDYELAKTLIETAVNGGNTEEVVRYTAEKKELHDGLVKAGTQIAFDILNDNALTEMDYQVLADEFNYLERQGFTSMDLPDAHMGDVFDEARKEHPGNDKIEPWVRAQRVAEYMDDNYYDGSNSFAIFALMYVLTGLSYIGGASARVGNNISRRLSTTASKPKH